MKLIKYILCFFAGHKPIKKVTEDNGYFWGSVCDRCKGVLGFPLHLKGVRSIPPPWSNKQQLKLWDKYLDQIESELRERIKNQA